MISLEDSEAAFGLGVLIYKAIPKNYQRIRHASRGAYSNPFSPIRAIIRVTVLGEGAQMS